MSVKLTIDGRPVEVPEGTNLIEAAKMAGIVIPHFCYHPRLTVVGQCRMCLVEIEGAPKIQAACTTPIREGMVVHATSEKAKEAQAATMEFLLINHPLDCPICDQAGECKLQDNAFGHGHQASRYDERKKQFEGFGRTKIGPRVIADMTRCIQCTRCIRFTQEIAGTGELTFLDRAGRTLVWTHDGRELDNDWSACAADVCPVGALTTEEFRFRQRVWYLEKTPSVCFGCDIGCNLTAETSLAREDKTSHEVVYRFLPRLNPEVNDYWLCDHGRFLAESLNERAYTRPVARESGQTRNLPWDQALDRVAAVIKEALSGGGPGSIFAVGSAFLSNEENWLLRKLFRDTLQVPHLDVAADPDRVRRMKSKNGWIESSGVAAPNLAGARQMGVSPAPGGRGLADLYSGAIVPDVLYVADASFSRDADDAGIVGRLRRARFLVVHARTENALSRAADLVFPAASLAQKDGTFTSRFDRVQRFERAMLPRPPVRADWEILLALARRFGFGRHDWNPLTIFSEIARDVPDYRDIDFRELEGGSVMKKGLFVSEGGV
jgi:NADH-quinone oxidoreductase subunit G